MKGSLRIIRGLQTKGVFLLKCEITPFFIHSEMAFFQELILESKELILINVENSEEKFKMLFPVIQFTPIYGLKLERL